MKKVNSLGNRIVALALSIIMVLGMVPTSVFAVEETPAYGTVESLTDGVTIDATGAELKTTYRGTLSWVAKDESIGRNVDGWWIGLKIIAPDTINMETAKYKRGDQEKLFKDYNDSADDADVQWMGLWSLVNEEYLRSANQTDGFATYTWSFDWDGDDEYEQTLVLDIDAAHTILLNNAAEQIYPATPIGDGVVSGITDGAVITTNGNTTIVSYADITLDWVAADPSIGRVQDGWWVGMKITAPAELTKEEDFVNVTFQSCGSNGWSGVKYFWDAQDSDKNAEETERYLTMWGLVTPELIAGSSDGILTYKYRFDWNKDGIYEQNLEMQIDVATVCLMKNGIQQLPLQFGAVDAITEGNVTGSGTANSVITFENITLTWDPADPSIGRVQDGWWVGAKITAPEGMTTIDTCENITYQRYQNGAWSEAKSFWDVQDSDKSAQDTTRYLTIWVLVTPERIEQDSDGILSYQYRFDWNQDGEYEQQLTLNVDCRKVTLLDENDVQIYPTLGIVTTLTDGTVTGNGTGSVVAEFDNVELNWAPADEEIGRPQDGWWVGIKVNVPSGADLDNIKYRRKSGDGWTEAMDYAPDEGAADTMQFWGLVTAEYLDRFINLGRNMNYTWQFDWNGDGTFEQTIVMTINPNNITLKQAGFAFDADEETIIYGQPYTIRKPSGGQASTITYSVENMSESDTAIAEIDAETNALIINKAGTVKITATLSGTHYETISASYILHIEHAEQTISFKTVTETDSLIYQPEPMGLPEITGNQNDLITYKITENDGVVAKIENGKLQILKFGYFEMTIVVAGDDCYKESNTLTWKVTVNKADQTDFGFVKAEDEMTYNDNDNQYTVKAEGGQSGGDVTYEIVEELYENETADVADIDPVTGVMTIKQSGIVKVKATLAGNDCYNSVDAYFILTVKKDSQEFYFAKESETVYYGTTEHTQQGVDINSFVDDDEIVYSISENQIGAKIDAATGKITFSDADENTGKLTITATKAGNERYDTCTKTYTLEVVYLTVDSKPVPDGDKLNDSDWYVGNVVIKAPTGYLISYKDTLSDNQWEKQVSFDKVGENQGETVYLKQESTGYISDAISVTGINVDTKDPHELKISYEAPLREVFLNGITFGLYDIKTLEVVISAEDTYSGIASIVYFDGTEEKTITVNGTDSASHSFTISAEYRDQITMTVTDISGRSAKDVSGHIIVMDTLDPGIKAGYEFATGEYREENGIIYTQGNVTINFTIDEDNLDLSNTVPDLRINGEPVGVAWHANAENNQLTCSYPLNGEGDYTVTVDYVDMVGHDMNTYEQVFHIDDTDPVIEITYDNNDAKNENHYKADRTATIKVTEHNFKPDEFVLSVAANNIWDKVDVSRKDYVEFAKDPANWKYLDENGEYVDDVAQAANADEHYLVLPIFDIEAHYVVTLDYTDLAGNVAETKTEDFVIDKTDADNIKIEYHTSVWDKLLEAFGIFKDEVTVTITAEDATAGVDYFVLTYTKQEGTSTVNKDTFTETLVAVQNTDQKNVFTATYTIPAQARGNISVEVWDKAGNDSYESDETVIVVDNKDPDREVIYTPYKILDAETKLDVTDYKQDDNSNLYNAENNKYILYYKDAAVVTFKITEANFDLSLMDEETKPVIKVNGDSVPVEWTQEGDVWTATHTISEDGDYVVTMDYTDLSTNKMVHYESSKIVIDRVDPEIKVTYTDGQIHQTITEGDITTDYYPATQTLTIQITDHSFRADEIDLTVTATNIKGDSVVIPDYTAYAKNRENWTSNGDVHTLNIEDIEGIERMEFAEDATYTFNLDYKDICDNASSYHDVFVVDHKDPYNVEITYETPIIEKIIEAITFGFYKPSTVIKLTANDDTAGIDYFELIYTREETATDSNQDDFVVELAAEQSTDDLTAFFATYTLGEEKNARGSFKVIAHDKASNKASDEDPELVIVTDTVSPEISIDYTAKEEGTLVHFTNGIADAETFADATTAYFNGNVIATVTINEANFFEGKLAKEDNNDVVVHEVMLKVTYTDDEGNVSVTEYLCDGAAQLVDGAAVEIIEWNTNGDEHTVQIEFANDGDYVLEIAYVDFSENEANVDANIGEDKVESYTSKIITVDKTAPVITVTYDNTDVKNTIDGRDYFDAHQFATITVKEHNFRAPDMEAVVSALDVVGNKVDVADFAAQLTDDKNWTHEGNVHTARIEYTVDANYTFDIDYKDLALNVAEDYTPDKFTVDTTAPTVFAIEYSTNVFDEVLSNITFGYYNAKMTVTITAEDKTSGIYYFIYSYINGKNVSKVNKQLLDQAIKEADITYDGAKATYTFEIPKMVLGDDNQFNGTVTFSAHDRSENVTEKKDNHRIVVDNIAPTATITYNAPVQNANGISYYDGDINATIEINEANFDAEDVVVTVTKDGKSYPVNVSWTNNSVDIHTGTFTLTEDGDYIVSVEYTDKSTNVMESYKSNRLTLDTVKPVIEVSNVKNNSANKDEVYGFTISTADTNLAADTFEVTLTAVITNDNGVYTVETISLGDLQTVEAGKSYYYQIENLEADGLYTLTAEIKDMSGNTISVILLEDGNAYETVAFSINRYGSAFRVDENTDKLVNQYYVYSVNNDVVIEEVNVDPIENYTVKLNGTVLTEGTDYTTTQTSNEGEWSKRTYVISKALFEAEGEYTVVVESVDKAESAAYSDVKNLNVSFVVDQTAPVLTITGLDNNSQYQVEEQTVTVIPTDDGGRLYGFTAIVLDNDGNPKVDDETGEDISVRFSMEGDELLEYLEANDGRITFTIPEGYQSQVQIICTDCAENADGETNAYEVLYEKVTVTQNEWLIFYAKKPLFYGTVGGVLLLIGLIVLLIVRKKNKKGAQGK